MGGPAKGSLAERHVPRYWLRGDAYNHPSRARMLVISQVRGNSLDLPNRPTSSLRSSTVPCPLLSLPPFSIQHILSPFFHVRCTSQIH